MEETGPDPLPGRVSVVIPAFNSEGWIGSCITHVTAALAEAGCVDAEIIVVDDGSTDGTVDEAGRACEGPGAPGLIVVSQANGGRFQARAVGLARVSGDVVLFVDTRVVLERSALAYALPFVCGQRALLTAHIEAATDESRIAGFWQAIEHVAWRRYFRDPRHVTFGIDEFDWYPKGTTAMVGPTSLVRDAFAAFEPTVDDWRKANDDTAVLRWVAERTGITVAPGFRAVYHSRTTLGAFLRHAEHRGTVLIDGHLRPDTRFGRPIMVVLAASVPGAALAVRRPAHALALAAAGSIVAGAGSDVAGARREDARILGLLAAPFGLAYLAGMWHGVAIRARTAARERVGSTSAKRVRV